MSFDPAAVQAAPYPFDVDPAVTALVIIDMRHDFLHPGGFGALLGNDLSLLPKVVEALQAVLAAARVAGMLVVHTRGGHRRGPQRLPAEQARARQPGGADRRRRPERTDPRPPRGGSYFPGYALMGVVCLAFWRLGIPEREVDLSDPVDVADYAERTALAPSAAPAEQPALQPA
jgi:hypothetical protein